jgi:hypothetical protein
MIRLLRRTALLLAAAVPAAGSAAAQTIPSPFRHVEETQRLGAHLGWLLTTTGITLDDSTALSLVPRSAPIGGVRYSVRVGGALEVQTTLSVSPSSRQLWTVDVEADSATVTPRDLETTVPVTVVLGDLGLRLGLTGPRTWNDLAPYVTATAGLASSLRGGHPLEEDIPEVVRYRFGPSLALGTAVGTDWFPARTTSLRVELQGMLWRVSLPQGFAPQRQSGRSEWNPAAALTVGAAIHF